MHRAAVVHYIGPVFRALPITAVCPPRASPWGPLSDAQRAGAEAAVGLMARTTSPHTRRTHARARRQLRSWLDDRPLDDASGVAGGPTLPPAADSPVA